MKKYLFMMSLLISSFASAAWREDVTKLLPPSLQELKLGTSTLKDVEDRIGKPALVRGTQHYWVYEGFEYALELTFENGKMNSLHFTFPSKAPSLAQLKTKLKAKDFRPSPEAPKKLLRYEDKTGSLTIDMTKQTIHSVRLK